MIPAALKPYLEVAGTIASFFLVVANVGMALLIPLVLLAMAFSSASGWQNTLMLVLWGWAFYAIILSWENVRCFSWRNLMMALLPILGFVVSGVFGDLLEGA